MTSASAPRQKPASNQRCASPIPSPEQAFPDIDDALERIADHCNAYRGGILWRSLAQLGLNLLIFLALVAASYGLVKSGYWPLSLVVAVPAAGMLVRIFIVQHDCGHGSFFQSKLANHTVGMVLSVLTFTPYGYWRDSHNRHHATSGNLDRRGIGGVDTLTVSEFKRLSKFKQRTYKFYRHPLVLLVFGPPIYFILMQRLPFANPMPYSEIYVGMKTSRIWQSVMTLNLALILFYGTLAFIFGPIATLIVFFPIVSLSGIIGAWLFYIQHQYEETYLSLIHI